MRSASLLPRRVSNDHIIQFGGQDWEAPRGLDGERVEVHRRLLEDDALFVVHRGDMVRLSPPDLARNATSHRGKLKDANPAPGDEDKHPAPKTASTMAFEKAFAPMTDADGGYPASPPDDQE
jgi:hypothetical protein